MTTLNDFYKTDLVDDHLANDVNVLIAATLRSEYKNVETLSATRTLLDADTPIQRFECGASDRTVKMPTADSVNNHPYAIINASAGARTITLQNNAGSTTYALIAQGASVLAIPDGNGGYFVIAIPATTAENDVQVGNGAGGWVKKTLAELLTIIGKATASGLASLDGSSKVVQDPANATATPTASKIPIADGSGKLDGWITNSNVMVQAVYTQTGAVATGTTTMPGDDTIPQNTEGDEYMTLAITPTSATNKLLIEFIGNFAVDNVKYLIAALFQDTTAGALAAVMSTVAGVAYANQAVLRHEMVAGTTSATTFKVRVGAYTAGGTVTFNGAAGGRYFGGVMASSIRITEIKV